MYIVIIVILSIGVVIIVFVFLIRESVDSLCRDATDTHSVTQTEAWKNLPRTKL